MFIAYFQLQFFLILLIEFDGFSYSKWKNSVDTVWLSRQHKGTLINSFLCFSFFCIRLVELVEISGCVRITQR